MIEVKVNNGLVLSKYRLSLPPYSSQSLFEKLKGEFQMTKLDDDFNENFPEITVRSAFFKIRTLQNAILFLIEVNFGLELLNVCT